MRKFALIALSLLITLSAFAHAGEVHTYMGTITTLHDDGSFMLKKTDGETMHVAITNATVFQHASGKSATRTDVNEGQRAAVTIAKDGKTATKVKLGAAKK